MGTPKMRPLTRFDAVHLLCDAVFAKGVEPTIEVIWPYLNAELFHRNSVCADIWEWRDSHGLTVRAMNAAQADGSGSNA